MREEYFHHKVNLSLRRITPAHAGRIIVGLLSFVTLLDHPRACGKNYAIASCKPGLSGSPPRMREESISAPFNIRNPGITPAHAGRMRKHNGSLRGRRDHPRACGKNRMAKVTADSYQGSPPRMREEFLF